MKFVIAVEGLDALDDIEHLDERVLMRARQAINTTLRRARTRANQDIRQQVAFKTRYLGARLRITQYAEGRDLQGTTLCTGRPTSLDRCASSAQCVNGQVAPGRRKRMGRAFLLPLRGGSIGLALRLKPGERLRNKKRVTQVSKTLYLLYGPAVNQVFAGVAEDRADDFALYLQDEFTRLKIGRAHV